MVEPRSVTTAMPWSAPAPGRISRWVEEISWCGLGTVTRCGWSLEANRRASGARPTRIDAVDVDDLAGGEDQPGDRVRDHGRRQRLAGDADLAVGRSPSTGVADGGLAVVVVRCVRRDRRSPQAARRSASGRRCGVAEGSGGSPARAGRLGRRHVGGLRLGRPARARLGTSARARSARVGVGSAAVGIGVTARSAPTAPAHLDGRWLRARGAARDGPRSRRAPARRRRRAATPVDQRCGRPRRPRAGRRLSRPPVTPSSVRSAQVVRRARRRCSTSPSAVVKVARASPRTSDLGLAVAVADQDEAGQARAARRRSGASSTSSKPAPPSTSSQSPATRAFSEGGSSTVACSPKTPNQSPGGEGPASCAASSVTAGPQFLFETHALALGVVGIVVHQSHHIDDHGRGVVATAGVERGLHQPVGGVARVVGSLEDRPRSPSSSIMPLMPSVHSSSRSAAAAAAGRSRRRRRRGRRARG